jgi:hypothetical protein
VELVATSASNLPAMFGPAHRVSHPWQVLLVGRRFRGLQTSSDSGDVALNLGRYGIRFVRAEGMVVLDSVSAACGGLDRREWNVNAH